MKFLLGSSKEMAQDWMKKLQQELKKPSPLTIGIGVALLVLIAVLVYMFMIKPRQSGSAFGNIGA